MQSPAFSDFRQWLDMWDNQEAVFQVKSLLENNGLVLFFQKGSEIYGAPESSRVTFARMKNPEDEDMPDGWEDEASFFAFNLLKALAGERMQVIFNKKDMKGLKILDQPAVEKLLSKKKGKSKGIPDIIDDEDGDPAAPERQPQVNKVDEK